MKKVRILKDFFEKHDFAIDIIVTILLFIVGTILSWIATCGIVKLITMCFGLTFKWSVATGIWLIICVLRSIFS